MEIMEIIDPILAIQPRCVAWLDRRRLLRIAGNGVQACLATAFAAAAGQVETLAGVLATPASDHARWRVVIHAALVSAALRAYGSGADHWAAHPEALGWTPERLTHCVRLIQGTLGPEASLEQIWTHINGVIQIVVEPVWRRQVHRLLRAIRDGAQADGVAPGKIILVLPRAGHHWEYDAGRNRIRCVGPNPTPWMAPYPGVAPGVVFPETWVRDVSFHLDLAGICGITGSIPAWTDALDGASV